MVDHEVMQGCFQKVEAVSEGIDYAILNFPGKQYCTKEAEAMINQAMAIDSYHPTTNLILSQAYGDKI